MWEAERTAALDRAALKQANAELETARAAQAEIEKGAVRVGDILVPAGVRRLLTASETARNNALREVEQLRQELEEARAAVTNGGGGGGAGAGGGGSHSGDEEDIGMLRRMVR